MVKILRKLSSIILSILIFCSNFFVLIEATKKPTLIGYYKYVESFDNYMNSNLQLFVNSLETSQDKIIVGNPLTIFSDTYHDIQLYPFIANGKVVATLEVFEIDGVVGSCFSNNYVDFLNEIVGISTYSNPMFLYRDSTGIYCTINDNIYTVVESGKNCKQTPSSLNTASLQINNSFEGIEVEKNRSGYAYCVFQAHDNIANGVSSCATLSLWAILYNYGIEPFSTFELFRTDYANHSSDSNGFYTSYGGMLDYFEERNITFSDDDSVNTGNLTMTKVQTMTQTDNKYALAYNKEVNGNYLHTTAVVGFAGSTSSSFYIFYNPHTGGNGRVYVDSTTKTFISSSITYRWEMGQIAFIDASNANY